MSLYSVLTLRSGRIPTAQSFTRNAIRSNGLSGSSGGGVQLQQVSQVNRQLQSHLLRFTSNTPARSNALQRSRLLFETPGLSLKNLNCSGFHARYPYLKTTSRPFSGGAQQQPQKKGRRFSKRKKSFQKHSLKASPETKSKKNAGKKKTGRVAVVDPSQWKGPRGRPVMTEHRYLEHETLQDTLDLGGIGSNHRNPKEVLYHAKNILEFDLQIKHKATSAGAQPLFTATITTFYPDGDLASYGKDHPHVFHRTLSSPCDSEGNSDNSPTSSTVSSTSTELVCVGVAGSKKKAETMAAADTLLLLYEIGIDGRNPPSFKDKRLAAARAAQEESEALFKADLARAQMILEMVNSSRPTFTVTEGNGKVNGNPTWIATASCFVRGKALSATTDQEVTKRKEAERKALVAIATSDKLRDIVGSDVMETYETLIENSPGKHIASLVIPQISDDLIDDVANCVGTESDHDLRISRHYLAKDEYEFSLKERHSNDRNKKVFSLRKSRSNEEREAINDAFQKEEEARAKKQLKNPDGKEAAMKSVRDALPIKAIRQDLIDVLRTEQVVVISGGTGSGKSTQCPQYILEAAIADGAAVDTQIIVTQPRRIAAISVSERVAAERCEKMGNSIGYSVRFKRQPPREYGGSVEFVTTGVLLRRLINDPSLTEVSHVMIDEVHERDINTDFLLVLLRDLLKSRPDLKVILMSATLDAESFSNYFSRERNDVTRVPLLSVPTQPRHPVEVFYLEDLTDSDTSSIPNETVQLAQTLLHHNDAQLKIDLEEALAEEEAAEELQARSRAEDAGEILDSDSDIDSDEYDSDMFASSPTKRRVEKLKRALSLRDSGSLSPDRGTSNKVTRTTMVDLLVKVAQQVCEEEVEAGRSGSILCFLPGWDEIKLATEEMEKIDTSLRKNIVILPLHSTIPHDDQQKVFAPALGKVKVILSTNIAESSVTIDDVLAVIDSGLVREMNYDAELSMSAMETKQTSRASATQRLGRAGRVAPGKCYRLYSRGDFEAMSARPTPEIQRTALEATCLQTCSMTTKNVEDFLCQALDPPQQESVSRSMERLIQLGAIGENDDGEEALTPLGRFLARLPLDPATGRMLIMGVVMKCLEPLLTTAACFSSKSAFYNPPGKRDQAQEIRKSLSKTSDIMATVQAYNTFWSMVEDEGWPQAKDWAFDNFVSISAMTSIQQVRSQLLDELKRTGLVPPSDFEGRQRKPKLRWDAEVNKNADIEKLFSAIWATAFPGNLASRRPLGSFGTLRTRLDQHAGLHPSSVLFHRKPTRGVRLPYWYLYREMVLSSQIFLRAATSMDPTQILLFGGYSHKLIGNDSASTSRVRGVLDDWIVVEGYCSESVDLLVRTREAINMALEHKAMFPKASIPDESQEILDIVCDVLDPFDSDDDYDD